MENTDWAYLAGMIDGEGCITVRRREKPATAGDRKRGVSYSLRVSIGGEVNHLTQLCADTTLGSVWIRKREGQRHLAEWSIGSYESKILLLEVLPYLRLKKSQAQVGLAMPQARSRWDATPELRQEQEQCRLTIQELNRLGRGKKEAQ